ncbi:MAG: penicillin-binding protein 2, partial [Bacteroidia bacterium]|nr:penicillin-binding protein 2 [Bacteroidia bacterium]
IKGIQESCNAYIATVYRRIIDKYDKPSEGLDNWNKHVTSFGLGNYLGYDLAVGQPGKIPSSATYNRMYGENRWYSTFTISNAIGQGEVLATPIQLANMTAAIANRGHFYTPHIIKHVEGQEIDKKYTTPKKTTIDAKFFEPIVEGMNLVYKKGTAKYIQIPGIDICGKTGTAENFTKINGVTTQLTDHSIFIAFAPKDDPKIAMAVYVENGYWGSRWAGRIAGLMIEKYLKGKITRTDMERYVLNGNLEEEYAKPYSGESFWINDKSEFQEISLPVDEAN